MRKGMKHMVHKKQTNAILVFMAVMSCLTILSRTADSLMVPQVAVSPPGDMELKYAVEIEGRVGTEKQRALYCQENLRIENVLVEKNDMVEPGDVLFLMDMDDLAAKMGQVEQEIRKCELQIADLENEYQVSNVVSADEGQNGDAGVEVHKNIAVALQQMEKENLEDSLQQLQDLREKNGCVYAEWEGRILTCSISTGCITTSEPVMIFEDFSQPFAFEGFVDEKDASFVVEGMEGTLEMKKKDILLEGIKICKVTEGEEGMYRVTAKVDSASVCQTGRALLYVTKNSRRYQNCIPLSALYSGSQGYYVIEVREDETVLGLSSVAEYVPVALIESNDEYAAVEGELSEDSKLVVKASRTIQEGDRVRILEE